MPPSATTAMVPPAQYPPRIQEPTEAGAKCSIFNIFQRFIQFVLDSNIFKDSKVFDIKNKILYSKIKRRINNEKFEIIKIMHGNWRQIHIEKNPLTLKLS